jgi:S-adenosylmethionine synthetase
MMKTAECVFPGHPDKICDQISDAILDECLKQDPSSRVAIETMGGHGIISVTGELTTNAYVDIKEVAERVYKDLGYDDEVGLQVNVVSQSPEISQGVDTGGAGDQGIMVGYATKETETMMPLEYELARKLAKGVAKMKGYGPDGKCQVTVDGKKIKTVVLSVQTKEKPIEKTVVEKILGESCENYYFNPTGKFEIGGFEADTGLTGRKLAVDNYGPQIPIGGGAFSGKDPSKVDRSAAYMARHIAKWHLSKTDENEALVKIAYSIGIAEPVMVTINGEERTDLPFDLTPRGIIKFLDLKRPIYQESAMWGHFGSDGFSWEKVSKENLLKTT